MKKLCFILVAISASFVVNAQEGIRLGVKGSYSSTWLFNKNVSDQNASLDYASTFSGGFGAQAIFMFSETYGMSAEVNLNNQHQKYDGYANGNANDKFTNEIKLSYIDIPVMFRVSSPRGPFFELGPQFCLLTGAKETFDYSPNSAASYTDKDFKDDFKGFGVAAVLGFGIDIKLAEMLNLTTGFRFGYMFSDATTEYTLAEATALNANDKLSNVSAFSHSDDKGNFKYQPTSRAYGGLQLGLQLKIGK